MVLYCQFNGAAEQPKLSNVTKPLVYRLISKCYLERLVQMQRTFICTKTEQVNDRKTQFFFSSVVRFLFIMIPLFLPLEPVEPVKP